MDYGRPDLADRLAAEYVLGTLRAGARRRFEALVGAHPALRQARRDWEDRLAPLTTAIAPVAPPDSVWARIVERLDGRSAALAPAARDTDRVADRASDRARRPDGVFAQDRERGSAWTSLGFWRLLTGLASVAAIGLAVLLAVPKATPLPPVLVVLAPADGSAGVPIVAGLSSDLRTLVAQPLRPVAERPDRSLELWALPKGGGAPRSLGLLPDGARGSVAVDRSRLVDAEGLAVSLEPKGGSPTGNPTGPVVYSGKFSL